ncbi:hypothetical protein MEQU1_002238 [Malassezia equina]|uniref:Conserved oligomeric Golgi complex subunit 7 n=1 Tax=Malassezia equina TaxID=1381935 RepID=A0AAF0EFE2_9BASI|nr:hypothetical protein MEQU1_002238 [Malassezia equina]
MSPLSTPTPSHSGAEAPSAAGAMIDPNEALTDRVAWLQAHLATVQAPADAKPCGPWSQRLTDAGILSLEPLLQELMRLHTALEERRADVATKTTFHMQQATQVVPHAVTQIQRVAEETKRLRQEMHAAQSSYQEVCKPTAPERAASAATLDHVHRLARAKQHMQVARDMLQAVDAWSLVRTNVSALLADKQYLQAAERLRHVEASLAPFDAASAYVERQRRVHTELVHALVDAVTPSLVRAVRDLNVHDICTFADVLTQVGQAPVFDTLYTATRAESVQAAWHEAQSRSMPDAIEALGIALTRLVQQEVAVLAPAVWGHGAFAVLLLATTLANVRPSLASYLQSHRTAPLPDLVQAFTQVGHHAQAWQALLTPHGQPPPPPRPCRVTTLSVEWHAWLRDAFQPFQHTYRSLEERYLAHAWHATEPNFESRLGRIWVTSLGHDGAAAWTPCVGHVADLLHEQVALCATMRDAALERMAAFTGGACAADVRAALTSALYEPCVQRLCTTMDTVRTRFRQHMRSSAPPAAHVLHDDHMDAVHDWDLVRAGVQLLAVARAAHELVQAPTDSVRRTSINVLLPATSSAPAARLDAPDVAMERVTWAAHQLVLELILAAFRRHLEAYRVHGAWRRPEPAPAAPSAADARVPVPSFSRSPTEGMVRLGEGLLNLPRLLESLVERELPHFAFQVDLLPWAHEDEGGARLVRREARALSAQLLTQVDDAASAASATDHVLSLWLRSLTRTLLADLEGDVLPHLVQQADYDRLQLAADVDYLSTMASALNASSAPLREWAERTGP